MNKYSLVRARRLWTSSNGAEFKNLTLVYTNEYKVFIAGIIISDDGVVISDDQSLVVAATYF